MNMLPAYREWRRAFRNTFGGEPNVNDRQYDYRRAWRAGIQPEPYEYDPTGIPHWPSVVEEPPRAQPVPLKQDDHPTGWMERFMQEFGTDPHVAPPEQLRDALLRGIHPRLPPLPRYQAPGRE